jgi:dihydrofolate synthase/folylpolyglutamate synthase
MGSMGFKNFAEVHKALEAYWPSKNGHRHGLDFMREVLGYLGNPQDKLRIIHVAGTSGKTSTAYYTAALLTASGKRVGLTVSPHVDEINERVQIDMQPMAEAEFCAHFGEFLTLIEQGNFVPHYFELFVLFAFWEFARKQLDYMVVEVGMGGLLDSTNVITRQDKVCVITDIGFDHMSLLGRTLPEIAAQKAGIIQLHNAVFCYRQGEGIMHAIRETARQKMADLHVLSAIMADHKEGSLPLFQQRNFGLSKEVVQYVAQRDRLQPLSRLVEDEAARTYIPARMEVLPLGAKTLILDAAHNEQKLHALLQSIEAKFGKPPMAVLFRIAPGEIRMRASVGELMGIATHIIITSQVRGEPTPEIQQELEKIAVVCRKAGYAAFEVVPDPVVAFERLKKRPEPMLLATGSFILLNHLRPLLKRK